MGFISFMKSLKTHFLNVYKLFAFNNILFVEDELYIYTFNILLLNLYVYTYSYQFKRVLIKIMFTLFV